MLKLNIKQLFLALQTESTIPALLSETLNILPDCPKFDLAISLLAGGKSTPKISSKLENWTCSPPPPHPQHRQNFNLIMSSSFGMKQP